MTEQAQGQPDIDSPEFWDLCYQQGMTPWEYGTFAPPLKTFLETPYKMPPGKLAVLGCGTGHDALLLARSGYQVTAIDFSQHAISATHKRFQEAGIAGSTGFLLHRNVFDLFEYHGYFDSVFEHTCFCSIAPDSRKRYFFAIRDLLRQGGKFLALWWIGERRSGGLPFSITKDEIFEMFDGTFSFDLVYEPQDSFPQDQGKELITLMTKL